MTFFEWLVQQGPEARGEDIIRKLYAEWLALGRPDDLAVLLRRYAESSAQGAAVAVQCSLSAWAEGALAIEERPAVRELVQTNIRALLEAFDGSAESLDQAFDRILQDLGHQAKEWQAYKEDWAGEDHPSGRPYYRWFGPELFPDTEQGYSMRWLATLCDACRAWCKRKGVPALGASVVDDLVRSLSPAATLTIEPEEARIGNATIRPKESDGRPLPPAMLGWALQNILERGLPALRSVDGWRILEWQVREGFARAANLDIRDPRRLLVRGGLEALADRARIRRMKVRDILDAEVALELRPLPGFCASGRGLITWLEYRTGLRHDLEIILGGPLLPGYCIPVRKTTVDGRDARRLVPMLPEGQLVGRPHDWAAQVAFQRGLAMELRRGAAQIEKSGGVLMRPEDLRRLAMLAGLPEGLLDQVVDAMVLGGDDAPAILERIGTNRFHIARTLPDERAFLEEGPRHKEKAKNGWRRRRK